MPRGHRARLFAALLGGAALAVAAAPARASTPASTGDDAAARAIELLRARESALDRQSAEAAATARWRGRLLYRLLLHEAAERRGGGNAGGPIGPAAGAPGGRAVSLGAAVLERDLAESTALRDELERVREERRVAVAEAERLAAPAAEPGARDERGAPPRLRAPVVGPLAAPYGVARDEATGAWMFRTSDGFAPAPGAPVVAPADGRVARIADDPDGGKAVVLAHPGGWTTVLSGLRSVDVRPREAVRRGGAVGAAGVVVRLEVWHGRAPIDPAALLAAPRERGGPRAHAPARRR